METPDIGNSLSLEGEDDRGDVGEVVTMVGKGCRILLVALTEEGANVALLLLLFLYCVILLWKDVSTGEDIGDDSFPRSSADRDHALRDMLRRSPRPPGPGEG
jgi:hypothetical protein